MVFYWYKMQVHPWINSKTNYTKESMLCKVLGTVMTIFMKLVGDFLV